MKAMQRFLHLFHPCLDGRYYPKEDECSLCKEEADMQRRISAKMSGEIDDAAKERLKWAMERYEELHLIAHPNIMECDEMVSCTKTIKNGGHFVDEHGYRIWR